MMEFQFSKHALERMKIRNISENQVRTVINQPDKVIDESHHKVFQSANKSEDGKVYLYRVFVNTDKKPSLVITVYRTSKIEKYI